MATDVRERYGTDQQQDPRRRGEDQQQMGQSRIPQIKELREQAGSEVADFSDKQLVEAIRQARAPDQPFEEVASKAGFDPESPTAEYSPREQQKFQSQRQAREEDLSGFSRGLMKGLHQTAGSAYGLLGMGADVAEDVTGVGESVRDWAMEGYKGQMREARKYPTTRFKEVWEDPSLSGLASWAAGTAGKFAPDIVGGVVTGGLGGVATGAARAGARKAGTEMVEQGVESLARRQIAKGAAGKIDDATLDTLKNTAARNVGQTAGFAGYGAGVEGGQFYGEAAQRLGGEEASPYKAALTGLGAGAIELAGGNIRLLKNIFGEGTEQALGKVINAARKPQQRGAAMNVLGEMLRESARQAPAEAGQEFVQEAMGIANINWQDPEVEEYLTEENTWQLIEGAAAGGLMGILGGAGGPTLDAARGRGAGESPKQRQQELQRKVENQESVIARAGGEQAAEQQAPGIVKNLQQNREQLQQLTEAVEEGQRQADQETVDTQQMEEPSPQREERQEPEKTARAREDIDIRDMDFASLEDAGVDPADMQRARDRTEADRAAVERTEARYTEQLGRPFRRDRYTRDVKEQNFRQELESADRMTHLVEQAEQGDTSAANQVDTQIERVRQRYGVELDRDTYKDFLENKASRLKADLSDQQLGTYYRTITQQENRDPRFVGREEVPFPEDEGVEVEMAAEQAETFEQREEPGAAETEATTGTVQPTAEQPAAGAPAAGMEQPAADQTAGTEVTQPTAEQPAAEAPAAGMGQPAATRPAAEVAGRQQATVDQLREEVDRKIQAGEDIESQINYDDQATPQSVTVSDTDVDPMAKIEVPLDEDQAQQVADAIEQRDEARAAGNRQRQNKQQQIVDRTTQAAVVDSLREGNYRIPERPRRTAQRRRVADRVQRVPEDLQDLVNGINDDVVLSRTDRPEGVTEDGLSTAAEDAEAHIVGALDETAPNEDYYSGGEQDVDYTAGADMSQEQAQESAASEEDVNQVPDPSQEVTTRQVLQAQGITNLVRPTGNEMPTIAQLAERELARRSVVHGVRKVGDGLSRSRQSSWQDKTNQADTAEVSAEEAETATQPGSVIIPDVGQQSTLEQINTAIEMADHYERGLTALREARDAKDPTAARIKALKQYFGFTDEQLTPSENANHNKTQLVSALTGERLRTYEDLRKTQQRLRQLQREKRAAMERTPEISRASQNEPWANPSETTGGEQRAELTDYEQAQVDYTSEEGLISLDEAVDEFNSLVPTIQSARKLANYGSRDPAHLRRFLIDEMGYTSQELPAGGDALRRFAEPIQRKLGRTVNRAKGLQDLISNANLGNIQDGSTWYFKEEFQERVQDGDTWTWQTGNLQTRLERRRERLGDPDRAEYNVTGHREGEPSYAYSVPRQLFEFFKRNGLDLTADDQGNIGVTKSRQGPQDWQRFAELSGYLYAQGYIDGSTMGTISGVPWNVPYKVTAHRRANGEIPAGSYENVPEVAKAGVPFPVQFAIQAADGRMKEEDSRAEKIQNIIENKAEEDLNAFQMYASGERMDVQDIDRATAEMMLDSYQRYQQELERSKKGVQGAVTKELNKLFRNAGVDREIEAEDRHDYDKQINQQLLQKNNYNHARRTLKKVFYEMGVLEDPSLPIDSKRVRVSSVNRNLEKVGNFSPTQIVEIEGEYYQVIGRTPENDGFRLDPIFTTGRKRTIKDGEHVNWVPKLQDYIKGAWRDTFDRALNRAHTRRKEAEIKQKFEDRGDFPPLLAYETRGTEPSLEGARQVTAGPDTLQPGQMVILEGELVYRVQERSQDDTGVRAVPVEEYRPARVAQRQLVPTTIADGTDVRVAPRRAVLRVFPREDSVHYIEYAVDETREAATRDAMEQLADRINTQRLDVASREEAEARNPFPETDSQGNVKPGDHPALQAQQLDLHMDPEDSSVAINRLVGLREVATSEDATDVSKYYDENGDLRQEAVQEAVEAHNNRMQQNGVATFAKSLKHWMVKMDRGSEVNKVKIPVEESERSYVLRPEEAQEIPPEARTSTVGMATTSMTDQLDFFDPEQDFQPHSVEELHLSPEMQREIQYMEELKQTGYITSYEIKSRSADADPSRAPHIYAQKWLNDEVPTHSHDASKTLLRNIVMDPARAFNKEGLLSEGFENEIEPGYEGARLTEGDLALIPQEWIKDEQTAKPNERISRQVKIKWGGDQSDTPVIAYGVIPSKDPMFMLTRGQQEQFDFDVHNAYHNAVRAKEMVKNYHFNAVRHRNQLPDPAESTASAQEGYRMIRGMQQRLKTPTRADTIIVESFSELPSPVQTQLAQGGLGRRIKALKDGSTIYMIRKRHRDNSDLLRTWTHEHVGHFGLRDTFGSDQAYNAYLDSVAKKYTARMDAIRDNRNLGNTLEDTRTAAEEVVAEMLADVTVDQKGKVQPAEAGTLVDRVVSFVQRALRKAGLFNAANYTKAEIKSLAARAYKGLDIRHSLGFGKTFNDIVNANNINSLDHFRHYDPDIKDRIARHFTDQMRALQQFRNGLRREGYRITSRNDVWGQYHQFNSRMQNQISEFEQQHVEPLKNALYDAGVSHFELDQFIEDGQSIPQGISKETMQELHRRVVAIQQKRKQLKKDYGINGPALPHDDSEMQTDTYGHTVDAISGVEATIASGEKNSVKQAFLNLVRDTGTRGRDLYTVYRVEKMPDGSYSIDPQEWAKYVNVQEGNNRYLIDVHHAYLRDAMEKMHPEQSHQVFQFAHKANRLMANALIKYNPQFWPVNFSRDAVTGLIHLKAAEKQMGAEGMARGTARRIFPIMRQFNRYMKGYQTPYDEHFRNWQREGGQMGYSTLAEARDFEGKAKELERYLTHSEGKMSALYSGWSKFEQVIDRYNKVMENATRIASYVEAVENHDWSTYRAARMSKELTINFDRKGNNDWMRSLYLFLNAGVQGPMATARWLSQDPKRGKQIITGAAVGGLILATMARLGLGEDETGESRYEQIPDFVKEHSFIIPMPFLHEDGYLTIPKPYGFGAFADMGRFVDDVLNGRDAGSATMALASSVGRNFNPISGEYEVSKASDIPNRIFQMAMPTVLEPPSEAFIQNQSWTGIPVRTDDEATLAQNMVTNMQHMAKRYAGGTGKFVETIFTNMSAAMDGRLDELNKHELLTRRYYGGIPDFASEQAFYQSTSDLKRIRSRLHDLQAKLNNTYDPDLYASRQQQIQEYEQENYAELNWLRDQSLNVESDVSEYRGLIEAATDQDTKDQYRNQMIDRMRDFLHIYNSHVEEG